LKYPKIKVIQNKFSQEEVAVVSDRKSEKKISEVRGSKEGGGRGAASIPRLDFEATL